jgi:hypothetical protein
MQQTGLPRSNLSRAQFLKDMNLYSREVLRDMQLVSSRHIPWRYLLEWAIGSRQAVEEFGEVVSKLYDRYLHTPIPARERDLSDHLKEIARYDCYWRQFRSHPGFWEDYSNRLKALMEAIRGSDPLLDPIKYQQAISQAQYCLSRLWSQIRDQDAEIRTYREATKSLESLRDSPAAITQIEQEISAGREVTNDTMKQHFHFLAKRAEILRESSIFRSRVEVLEERQARQLLDSYQSLLHGRSVLRVRELVDLLPTENDQPLWASGIEEVVTWRRAESLDKSVFLIIADGLSQKIMQSWLSSTDADTKRLFDKTFTSRQVLLTTLPTLTAPCHVSIATGRQPGHHMVWDKYLVKSTGDVQDSAANLDAAGIIQRCGVLGTGYDRTKLHTKFRGNLSVVLSGGRRPHYARTVRGVRTQLSMEPKQESGLTLNVVQFPELDLHEEGIYEYCKTTEALGGEVVSKYQSFFRALLHLLEEIRQNAKNRDVPTLIILTADHGMDVATRSTEEQHQIVRELGLVKVSHAECPGLFPTHLTKRMRTPENRIGVSVSMQMSGKVASLYFFHSTRDLKIAEMTCENNHTERSTIYPGMPEPRCRRCGCKMNPTSLNTYENKIAEMVNQEWDNLELCLPEKIQLSPEYNEQEDSIAPSLMIFAKPSVFMKGREPKDDERIYSAARALTAPGENALVSVESLYSEAGYRKGNQNDETGFRQTLETMIHQGFLAGRRLPGQECLPGLSYSHFSMGSETPVTAILSHGSISPGEMFVPMLIAVFGCRK